MLFDSLPFVVFFSVGFLLYFTLPHAWQKWLLLIGSCYFYMVFVPKYILVLFFLISVDYVLAQQIERSVGKRRTVLLLVSIVSNLGVLFFFKYFNFFNQNIHALANVLHWNYSLSTLEVILPIGLSFHTFQSLAYIFEVYAGRFTAERNYFTYALYVMFFPQLVAGPIERPQNLLPQLRRTHSFDYAKAISGLWLMIWGFFKKIVIANNLAVVVDFVFNHAATANGSTILFAVFTFAIVLYADFSGYSDIAIGSARMLGIDLMPNFKEPYFAKSVAELWRRWHISLSFWFRDYVYYPLVLKGMRWGTIWIYGAVTATFFLTGVWHGAGWNFAAMGLFFGIVISIGSATKSFRDRVWAFLLTPDSSVRKIVGVVFTFCIASFAWIFFRASDLSQAWLIIERLFTAWGSGNFSYLTCTNYCAFYEIGVGRTTLALMGISVLILFAYELFVELELAPPTWWRYRLLRWPLYYVFILWILFVGDFVPKTFIYFQF